MIDLETKIAKALWHRFGNPNAVEWEDETHKAEYLDAAVQVLFIAAARIETLEAALREIVDTAHLDYEPYAVDLRDIARAALDQSSPPKVAQAPDGWKLVPIIPTQAMIEAGCDSNPTSWNEETDDGFAADVANDVYVAMVRSAPTERPKEPEHDIDAERLDASGSYWPDGRRPPDAVG